MSAPETKLIDANVILRYLLQDDESLFSRASGFLEKVRSGSAGAIVLDCVLAECVYVLLKVYKVDRRTITESLHGLLTYRGFAQPDREDLLGALEIFGRTNLSIVDCLLCSRSRSSGVPLLSFDEELVRQCQVGE